MRSWLRKLLFNMYYLGSPPWDTGITPPELQEFIAAHAPGRALDLGCGTGTNAITLAKAGWDVTGVDFSGRAIRMAKQKSRDQRVNAEFYRDDVTQLKDVSGKFDLIVDIGCFHGVPAERHPVYARNIHERLAPGGTFMLYVFFRKPESSGPGTTESELSAAFRALALDRREDGSDRGERRSAWLWFSLPQGD